MADTEPTKKPTPEKGLSRRQFLPGVAGVLAVGAAGVAGYELRGRGGANSVTTGTDTGAGTGTGTTTQPTAKALDGSYHTFLSRPDLRPPVIDVAGFTAIAASRNSPRFIAVAPISVSHSKSIQSGPMIIDQQGRVVWFKPVPGLTFDFKVQSYQGDPVLSWWSGRIYYNHGIGVVTVADRSYKTVKAIKSVAGSPTDLHDFVITSRGTALVTSYEETTTDLTGRGGPKKGKVWASHLVEMDMKTGKVLLDWNSLDSVPASDSYKRYVKNESFPYDYFHINSVSELPDGNLLVSGRNTSGIYGVDRSTGKTLWRMGGRRSDFQIAANAQFSWQHHVRARSPSTMTVFDNGMGTTNYSRGLLLSFDLNKRQVGLVREYLHPARFMAATLGSVHPLSGGGMFVGWGSQPYYSQHGPDGTMIASGEFPIGLRSYRAYPIDWVGHPTDRPAVVAKSNPAGGFVVYVSWNGATEVATWTVLAGKDKTSLQPVGSQPWSDFETMIAVNSTGPTFQVVAHDSNGNELGRSKVI